MGLKTIYQGKLTYTLAAAAVVWGIVGWIFGWLDSEFAQTFIWGGLSAFGVRRAIENNQ